jgi:enoyl-CoA hydratase/carnithine racemase
MQGQIFDGKEAAEIGLTDGTVSDIEEVIEMGLKN